MNNPRNPNNPPQLVTLGEATTDEMMLFYFAYTPGVPSDTLIVIDDGSGPAYYMDCDVEGPVGIGDVRDADPIAVWPSPTRERLHVQGTPANGLLRLRDPQGRLVSELRSPGPLAILDVSGQASGLYVAEVFGANGILVDRSKVLIE